MGAGPDRAERSAQVNSEAPDWRRPETYAYTQSLTRVDWAWEFLRRNPVFRRDVDELSSPPTDTEIGRLVQRWGIRFR